jgi:hypothetical protein
MGDVSDVIETKSIQASAPKSVALQTSSSHPNAPAIPSPIRNDKAEADTPKTQGEGKGSNASDDTARPDADVSLTAIMSAALAEKALPSCQLSGER